MSLLLLFRHSTPPVSVRGAQIFRGGIFDSRIIDGCLGYRTMNVQSGQTVVTEFTTRSFSSGSAADADETPEGILYINGEADSALVLVENQSTGVYRATVTLPDLDIGDLVSIVVTAVVEGISDNGKIWEGSKDILVGSTGGVSADLVATALDAIILASGITERFTDVDGNPMTELNARQGLALILAEAVGDRNGIGTRQIVANLPGESVKITADRISRTEIQSTNVVPN